MLPSAIKWVGGKSKLRRQVIERLPCNAECYCEVFAGAAWVLFGKKPHPVEVINDRDNDLANLWRVIKWRSAELLEEVQHWLYSRTMFDELKQSEPTTELDRAVRMYLLIQMAFGADVSSSQSASFGYWNKSPRDLFLSKSLDDIPRVKERMRQVFVENIDFEDCIKRYDQPNTVFFCDPPYLDTCGYAVKFGMEEHRRLREVLGSIEGRFLLTINDHSVIRDMYEGFCIEKAHEARAKALAIEGRQAAPVLFISNYVTEINATGSLFEEA
jgi:DNA adenine methylase